MTTPPPRRRRASSDPRTALATRTLIPLRQRLDAFVEHYDSTIQAVVEGALDEYMNARGFTWEEYAKRQQ